MKNYFLKCGWYLFALIGIIGCNPDIVDPPVTERKIVALNYVHEDNINGRIINPTIDLDTNIIANYRFVYNSNGTLNSISVFDDSSNFAILQKEVKFVYYPDRVRWYTFNAADTLRERVYDAFFNSKKQITRIADTANNGFNFYYLNDKLVTIEDTTPNTTFLRIKNFVYQNNNLVKYDVFLPNGTQIGYAEMEYSRKQTTAEFDMLLYSDAVIFLYIADLNILSKTGLNYGIGNTNLLLKKQEFLLPTTQTPITTYTFDYEYDRKYPTDIIKRSIAKTVTGIAQPDTLFYQYKY